MQLKGISEQLNPITTIICLGGKQDDTHATIVADSRIVVIEAKDFTYDGLLASKVELNGQFHLV